ncbi:unnamed protein product [Bemisia tabaci]|uniref:Peptidase M12A domain-containing protein n=1 Tax=Bemisia tabaci TaxID=7038 RepID=A0A9P0AFL5_BEMTA|nr:unnamed protein product [Bemisia tabaci]
MLVLWGLVLALAADVSGRAHVLPNGQVVEVVDEYAKVRRKKRMLKDKSKLWTGAAVPYEFAKSVWSSPAREYETMIEAMEEIMQETCLRFKERSGEEDFVRIDFQGAKE